MTATHEFVVPKSIPMIFPIFVSSDTISALQSVTLLLYAGSSYNLSELLSRFRCARMDGRF
jgi:hypothetical protein